MHIMTFSPGLGKELGNCGFLSKFPEANLDSSRYFKYCR